MTGILTHSESDETFARQSHSNLYSTLICHKVEYRLRDVSPRPEIASEITQPRLHILAEYSTWQSRKKVAIEARFILGLFSRSRCGSNKFQIWADNVAQLVRRHCAYSAIKKRLGSRHERRRIQTPLQSHKGTFLFTIVFL